MKISITLLGFLALLCNTSVFAETTTQKANPSTLPAKMDTGDDPRTPVNEAYRQEINQNSPLESPYLDKLFSHTLVGLIKTDNCVSSGEVGVLDWDPFINGQDGEVQKLVTRVVRRDNDKAVVEASFLSFKRKQSVLFDMVLEKGTWRIDDIRPLGEDGNRTSIHALFADAYRNISNTCVSKAK